ncbi:hypothetical protein [Paraburkholderia susongensis]|uniref:Uncharacterized protein n=1 Tax=Paraburkholderia susongensis TaxID=1515439 RepID=A0A1X7KRM4_9BURK|nr:hypothetical protein [Paraburkholderia susongensis]SMG43401.1 hypothetical protein SAMN06265784_104159 [Paraburkholderia susongensis]
MATVAQLREYLAGLPDDAEVFVLEEERGNYYTTTRFEPLNLDPYEGNVDYNTSLGTNHLYLGEN